MKKRILILIIICVAALTTIEVYVLPYTTPQFGFPSVIPNNKCLPTNLDLVNVNYPIKQPIIGSILDGYKLQAVDAHTGDIMLYYADHPICTVSQVAEETAKGTVLVDVVHNEEITNSTEEALKVFKLLNTQNNNLKLQFLDINGYHGVAWESLEGTGVTELNGTIINKSDRIPASVIFYNDNDNTGYGVSGMQPLEKLVEIAKTIPK